MIRLEIHIQNRKKGFTLAELLVVVAIVSILTAISIPIFTRQLETSREATDLANVRSAYAEVMAAVMIEDTENEVKVVKLKQKKEKWQSHDPVTIGGVMHYNDQGDTANWIGYPVPGGECEVSYRPDSGVLFNWKSGKGTGGSEQKYAFNINCDVHAPLNDSGILEMLGDNNNFEIDSNCTKSNMLPKIQAKIDVFALFLSGICGVLLAFNGFAYWALAIQSTVYVASVSLLKWMVVSWRPSLDFSIEPLKEMFPFSVKLFLTNIFQQVNNNVFSVLLGKLYNANVLGYYSQGNKWMTMGGSMLNNMINSVAQPVFVQVNDDLERQRNVFRKMVRFAAFVSFPAMMGLAFIAEEFICATIGNKWLESVPILQILCVQGAIGPLILLYTQVLVSHGKSDTFLYANVFHGILQLAILWLTASFGILCMVVAYVLTYVFMLFVWHLLVYRLIRVRLVQLAQDVLPYLVVTLFVFFVVYVLTIKIENLYILLLLKISLSILFYAFALWRLRSVVFLEGVNLLLNKWRK